MKTQGTKNIKKTRSVQKGTHTHTNLKVISVNCIPPFPHSVNADVTVKTWDVYKHGGIPEDDDSTKPGSCRNPQKVGLNLRLCSSN